jgi:hypothetical protein
MRYAFHLVVSNSMRVYLASPSSQPSADHRARSGPNHIGTRPVATPYAIVARQQTASTLHQLKGCE